MASSSPIATTPLDADHSIHGIVIDSDESVDLALIQLQEDLPEGIIAMELAEESARAGQTIHSIAGRPRGSEGMWVYSTGHVRQIAEGMLANGYETLLLESDMATNQGNSGGPVCDDEGRVVAVVEGHRTDARLQSIYVDLQILVDYLSEAIRCVDPKTIEDIEFAGYRHAMDGRSVVAAKLFTKALKLEPKESKWLVERGWCWWGMDDDQSAIADFNDALSIDSTNSDAHYGLGCIDQANKEFESAIKHFTNAIRNDTDGIQYIIDRAEAFRKLGQLKNARKDIERALNMDQDDSDAIRQLAFIDCQEGDYEAGINGIASIIEEFEDDPETVFFGCLCSFGLGDFESSAKLAKNTIDLDDEYPYAYYRYGLALSRLDRDAEALEPLRIADSRYPNDGDVKYMYGIVQMITGAKEEGIATLARAIELSPGNEVMKEMYESILEEYNKSLSATPNSQLQPVSTKSMPQKYVGTWIAKINGNDGTTTMQFELRSDATYRMTIQFRSVSGETNQMIDEGNCELNGNELVNHSKTSGETNARTIKWQGQHLGMNMKTLGGWVMFYRSK